MAQTQLVMVSRKGDIPRDHLLVKQTGETVTCEFCDNPCWANKHNLRELKFKRITPVIICVPCYMHGEHNRQGYRT